MAKNFFEIPKNAEEQEQQEKIIVIENMPIGIDEKVELLLVLAGKKSAADIELFSQPWSAGETARRIDSEIIANIKKNLEKLGFAFEEKAVSLDHIIRVEDDTVPIDEIKPEDEIHLDREKITIEVARNEEIKESLKKALAEEDHTKLGELYGFPKTAIEAFNKPNGLIKFDELPDDIRNDEAYAFYTFEMSRDNFREEFETIKKWSEFVKQSSQKIYKEYLENRREVKKR